MAGRHERPAEPRPDAAPTPTVGRQLAVAGALAVLVVAVVVALHFTRAHHRDTAAGPPTGHPTSAPRASTGPITTAGDGADRPSPTGRRTPTAADSATTTPSPTTTNPTASASPETTTDNDSDTSTARASLLVLNNSTVDDLGARAADDFRARGWAIAGIGDLHGRIRDTTIYFDPGYETQAHAFATQFPQVHRVLARIAGLPGSAHLTVVVTRYYAPATN
jgi:hypothetical protein